MTKLSEKEVSWDLRLDSAAISIYGTLTLPGDQRPKTGLVFVAGSGPTDRDWCSPLLPGTNGSAKLLANALAETGFATLRYDKVASGPNVRENLPKFKGKISMETHAKELAGAVETLASEGSDLKDNIFALTTSEGAIHSINYQLSSPETPFKGFVLTAPPGRAVGALARSQILSQAKALANYEVLMKHYDESIADFLAGRPIVIDPILPKVIEPFLRALENPNNLPFSRELWTYNLPDHLKEIVEPLLVVIGKKDIQVDWQADGGPLEEALSRNKAASFFFPENANHVLKYEELPREKLTAEHVTAHYNEPGAVLDAETLTAITYWLKIRA